MGKYVFNPFTGKLDYTETGSGNQPYYQYIYQPSATGSDEGFGEYLFNDWSELMAAKGAREVRIKVPENFSLPDGDWYLSDVAFTSTGNNPDSGDAPTITIDSDDATISDWQNLQFTGGLVIDHTSNAPVIDTSTPTTMVVDRTDIQSANVPFMEIHGAGLYAFAVDQGFGFRYNGSPVVNVASDTPAYSAIVVFANRGGVIKNNILSSDVAIVWGYLIQSVLMSDNSVPTFSGLDGGSINFAPAPNHIFPKASVMGFTSQPTGVSSTDVEAAIGELGGIRLQRTSSSADPTTTELPNDTDAGIHKNTSSGDVFLAYNDGGSTIVKVQLS